MKQIALTNARLVLPHRIIENGTLLLKEGKIAGIFAEQPQLDAQYKQIDVAQRLVTPGLIDIHIHGARGQTFNTPSQEAYSVITNEAARHGVTALLATTATDSIENLVECLAFTQEWMSSEHAGAQIMGSHVEGPYFALAQAGAQDPAQIRNPDDGTATQLLAFAEIIRTFTLAPELPGALELIHQLGQHNVTIAAGHSDATEEQLAPAIDAGLRHMIHIWSGQSSTVREGPWRKPGLLEVALTYDTLTAEMIADNRHLPPTLMKLAYKCLGPDRLCIISDATSGAGLAEGSRYRMGGVEYEVHDGVGMLFDRTAFAGSTTLLNQMLRNLLEVVHVPLLEAVRMATLTPARIIGIDEQKGSLQIGKDADVVIFNDDFEPWKVLVGGRWFEG